MPRTPKLEITVKERELLSELAGILATNPKHRSALKVGAMMLNLTYDQAKGRLARVRRRYLRAHELCMEYRVWRKRLNRRYLK